ncbi:glycosyltransferase [Ekhidna sp.]|uniref:glycosyltransferase n=1 Tax=Ekhidna sp. TaxID=2608089 RepID=UPI003298F3DF
MSQSSNRRNCIVIIFDDDFLDYARNCLLSFSNYPDHPEIKVIYQGKDQSIIAFIRDLDSVEQFYVELDTPKYSELNLGHIGSPMIYGRYICWSSLFDEYDKVLYIDCDTLILKPFPELFEKEDFFAVYDNAGKPLFNKTAYQNDVFLSKTEQDNIPVDLVNNLMINSGMLLIPRRYRNKSNFDFLHRLSERYSPFIEHSDQSIITIWCYLQNLKISCDYQYNYMIDRITRPTFGNVKLDDVKLLHFSYWKPKKNLEELLERSPLFVQLEDIIRKNSDFLENVT